MGEDRPIWGIHMGLEHGDRPIVDSYIAIGWDAVGNLGQLSATRDAYKNAVAKAYPMSKPGAVPVFAGTLFKFANDMKIGDLVIYPSKPDRMVNIGKISGNYTFSLMPDAKSPNRRSVVWIKQLPRAHFSQSALNEIGSAVTLFQVTTNADEFLAAIKGEEFEITAKDETTVEAASENTAETTKDFVIKRLKGSLDPYKFERFVAYLLEQMGYHTRVTQKSNDGGIDVIASRDELGFEPPIIKVQCKQTLGNTGQPDVAQLYGHIESREYGLFVSLGDYTAQARNFERSKHNLRLISGSDLVDLIFVYYKQFNPDYQKVLPLRQIYVPALGSTDFDAG